MSFRKLGRSVAAGMVTATVVWACATDTDGVPFDLTSTETDAGSTPDTSVIDTSIPEPPKDSGPPPVNTSCGDGVLATGEQCDDGNNASNDGCSATCQNEIAGPSDYCDGAAIALSAPDAGGVGDLLTGTVSGDTALMYNQTSGLCGGSGARDAVYKVTPTVNGVLTARISTANFNSILYARRTCTDAKTEASCNDASGNAGGEVLRINATAGQPIFLFVDGLGNAAGTFKLDVELTSAVCGDGFAELPEACDDGNTTNGDGCDADCKLEGGGTIKDCPGQIVTLKGVGNAQRKLQLSGDTKNAGGGTSTLTASGCSSSGENHVYAVTPDIDGSMHVKLVASYDNASLHARSECDTSTSDTQLACMTVDTPLEPVEITVPVQAGLATFVVVDATSNTTANEGPYTLDVTVSPAQCGNKVLDGNEACDDGNTMNGDGCSSTCQFENIAGRDICPGAPFNLTSHPDGTYTGFVTSTTTDMTADYRPGQFGSLSQSNLCTTTLTTTAKDAVFSFTSPINGRLTATLSAAFDSQIYVRNGICEGSDAGTFKEICEGAGSTGEPETLVMGVTAGTTYYMFVDTESGGTHGAFELGVVLAPSVCGNGTVEGGEECDDSNIAGGDGCSATCAFEPVGPGHTCQDPVQVSLVDDGKGVYTASVQSGTTNVNLPPAPVSDFATTGCSSAGPEMFFSFVAPIGGVLRARVPTASFNLSLAIRNACPTGLPGSTSAALACENKTSADGDEELTYSVVQGQTYYVVVDAVASSGNNRGPFSLLFSVTPSGCGDGILSAGEQCDDGNLTTGDGCNATCQIEALAGIDTCPGYVLPLSGSGTEPRTGVVTVNTATLAANYGGTCGGNAKDGVVAVTSPINGRIAAKLTGYGSFHPVLYARTACDDPTKEKSCDDDGPPPATSASRDLTITGVTAGQTYWFFIDGYNDIKFPGSNQGIGRLNITITP